MVQRRRRGGRAGHTPAQGPRPAGEDEHVEPGEGAPGRWREGYGAYGMTESGGAWETDPHGTRPGLDRAEHGRSTRGRRAPGAPEPRTGSGTSEEIDRRNEA